MQATDKQISEIIDIVLDYADYDVDVMGHRDYDVTASMTEMSQKQAKIVINEILGKRGVLKWIVKKLKKL